MLDEIIDLLDTFDIILWSVFFLVPTGRLSEIDLISAEEFEQVFDKLYQTSQRVLFDINSTDAQHYGRYLLQHCTEARRLSEQPAHTYNRMPQFSLSRWHRFARRHRPCAVRQQRWQRFRLHLASRQGLSQRIPAAVGRQRVPPVAVRHLSQLAALPQAVR